MNMEMCIKERSSPPYGGEWIINRPDIGIVGKGYIFDVLVDNCRQWRVANGVPVGLGFTQEVEKACCDHKPDHCIPCDPIHHPRKLTFYDVLTGTSTMIRDVVAGRPLVTGVEAERRAAICAKCQFNVTFSTPCGGICDSLKKMVHLIVGSATTTYDYNLRSCYFCGCFLQSAVWLPLDLQLKPLTDSQRAKLASVPHCWKKSTP